MNHRIELDSPQDFLVWRSSSGGSIEILDIGVGTERGVGKGRQLVNLLYEEIDRSVYAGQAILVFAMTRHSNRIAHDFYEHIGFRLLGSLYRFYTDNGDHAFVFGRIR